MKTNQQKKILQEISELPEEALPLVLQMIHIIKKGMTKRVKKRGSLKGIWKGSKIKDSLFEEAKKSLFPYESF